MQTIRRGLNRSRLIEFVYTVDEYNCQEGHLPCKDSQEEQVEENQWGQLAKQIHLGNGH